MVSQDDHCLFGTVHVRLATTCIGIICAILGAVIPVALLGGSNMELICGPLNLVVGIMTIYGADRFRPKYLCPLLVQCVFATGVLCVFLIFNTIYIIDKSFYVNVFRSSTPGRLTHHSINLRNLSEDLARYAGQLFMLAPQLYVESRNFDIVSAHQVLGPVSIFFVLVFVFLNVWIGRVTYRCLQYVHKKSADAKLNSA
uniref:Conserved plasma membrane protein n=1 Tax=Steinernema glaseri TaxID=37863 RepID=A0A1I8APM6_9BILA